MSFPDLENPRDFSYFAAEPEWWADWRPLAVPEGSLSFGFESEFDDLEPLLGFYEPLPEYALPGETPAATAVRLRALARSLPHGDRRALLRKKEGPPFLPETLFRDDTGNVELVLAPVEGLAPFWEQVSFVQAHFGRGSLQAMVGMPRAAFFADPAGALGWLNFFGDLDALARLDRNRTRVRGAARSFLHPYLGPMTELRHRSLRKYLRENAAGNLLAGEEISRVGVREHSFKFVGATAYRPDVAAPNISCLEVRDAHRDADLLRERVARIVRHWRRDRRVFARFAALPAFDAEAAFAALPAATQEFLREACAIPVPERVRAHPKPRLAYETFRNFAFPFHTWENYAGLLGHAAHSSFREDLAAAREAYLADLRRAAAAAPRARLDLAQTALAAFPRASGILAALRAEEERIFREDAHG